jgi:hypothetical protein
VVAVQSDAGLGNHAADGGSRSGADTGAAAGASGSASAPGDAAQTQLPKDAGLGHTGDDTGTVACIAPSMVNVCNPVTNSSCGTGTQCVPDLAALVLSGRCTFSSPMGAGACLATAITESCPAKSTCDNAACRTLCFCDTDCPKGECCHATIGTLGFKLCKPCP